MDEISKALYYSKRYAAVCELSDGMYRVASKCVNIHPILRIELNLDAGIWGFTNALGREVISPQYIFAHDFYHGIALVCKGEWEPESASGNNTSIFWSETMLWGYINKSGYEVIPCIYDEIGLFYEDDYARAHFGGDDGAWGVIDLHGNWIMEPIYADIDYYPNNGYIKYYDRDSWDNPETALAGLFDLDKKKVVFEPQYKDIDVIARGKFAVELHNDKTGETIKKTIGADGKSLPDEAS